VIQQAIRKGLVNIASMSVPILIAVGLVTYAYAESAVQSDWYAGPGFPGPVAAWEDGFDSGLLIYHGTSGSASMLPSVAGYEVSSTFTGPRGATGCDIDGDGDQDILAVSYYNGDVAWWENENGLGTRLVYHPIDLSYFTWSRFVSAADLDGDDDYDVICSSSNSSHVSCWMNLDGQGTDWDRIDVWSTLTKVYVSCTDDVDGDGDIDIIAGTAYSGGKAIWLENIDGTGERWTAWPIFFDAGSPYEFATDDIDGDGDTDLAVAFDIADKISWWENLDARGRAWEAHLVDGCFDGAVSVDIEDMNGDGDRDILGASTQAWKMTWWENVDGSGSEWTRNDIPGLFGYAISIRAADLDGDGDQDVVGAGFEADSIAWWENVDACGTDWLAHLIEADLNGPIDATTADMDGDGDLDVIGCIDYANLIRWWNLEFNPPDAALESSILDTQTEPGWGVLLWSAQTPPATSVVFQVRASDNFHQMGEWSDTLYTPGPLDGFLPDGNRYFQYKAILETDDPNYAPTLLDMTVTWDPFGIQGADPYNDLGPMVSPNPSPGMTTVYFSLGEASSASFDIYDLSGRLVQAIEPFEYSQGLHSLQITGLTPGVYFCRLNSQGCSEVARFAVVD
jgi:hypothetical protein